MTNAFREAVQHRDLDAMAAALHPDVVFHSPAVFKPYEGREATIGLLRHVLEVFEDFRYLDELSGDGSHGLVFAARVGDLTVMVRPLSGLIALAQAMAERVATDAPA